MSRVQLRFNLTRKSREIDVSGRLNPLNMGEALKMQESQNRHEIRGIPGRYYSEMLIARYDTKGTYMVNRLPCTNYCTTC